MLTAIFGDIHANLEALEAVYADAQSQGVTDYVCLGDVVGYNADPAACLDFIRELGCPVVKGNHDEDASEDHSLDNMNPLAAFALRWTREQLSEDQRFWLKRIRLVRQVSDYTIVHSTLDQPVHWNYVTNRYDAMSSFAYQFTQVCFHGHTHIPRVFMKNDKVTEVSSDSIVVEPDSKYFINVGSVGQPRDGDPRSCYVIYNQKTKQITFRRVAYDVLKTQEKIIKAGLPRLLADRLAEGS